MKKILGALVLVSALASPVAVFARGGEPEVSGGGGATVNVCSPISSLTVKGDGRVGETGSASVDMGWSVKPCDKTQTVRVQAEISNWTTKQVIYLDPDGILSGKIRVFVPGRQLYQGKVTVFDAVTGAQLDTKSFVVSTTPKGI